MARGQLRRKGGNGCRLCGRVAPQHGVMEMGGMHSRPVAAHIVPHKKQGHPGTISRGR